MEVGLKYDTGKSRPSLLLGDLGNSLNQVLNVLEYGAKKYTVGGWKHVPNAKERYTEALLRHALSFSRGEQLDSESSLDHLAHIACNALFLLYFREQHNAISKVCTHGNDTIPSQEGATRTISERFSFSI